MIPRAGRHGRWAIAVSFLFAVLLALLPLPQWAITIRPCWVSLVLIYWVIALPHRVSVGVAWLLGILLDTFYGTPFGEHAFALAMVAYLAYLFHRQIRVFPLWQQGVCVFLLVFVYQFTLLLLQAILQQSNAGWLFWVPAMTSMLLWPWVYVVLRDWRRYFKLT